MDVVEFAPEHSQLVYTFGGAAPVMRVRPGTALQLWSEDAFNHALTSVDDVASKVLDFRYLNPQTGPFYVEGAESGDTLAIHVAGLTPARSWGASAAIPFFGGMTSTDREGRLFIQRQWQRATDGTGYSFAIADAATDQALGLMGLWLRNIDEGRGCLGYWVASFGRGWGAAQHAVSSVSRWALDHLQIPRLELYVEPWNESSVRTAERAGFQREGLLRSWQAVGAERRDMWMYSLLRSDLPSD